MPATDRKSQFTPMSCSNPELAGIKSASAQNLNNQISILLFLVLRNSCAGIAGAMVRKETHIMDIKDNGSCKNEHWWGKYCR